jgi:hypothetical protein
MRGLAPNARQMEAVGSIAAVELTQWISQVADMPFSVHPSQEASPVMSNIDTAILAVMLVARTSCMLLAIANKARRTIRVERKPQNMNILWRDLCILSNHGLLAD